MKKYVLVIMLAVLIGGSFAYVVFKDGESDSILAISDEEKVYIFQLGVFSSLENATNKKEASTSAIIKKINDYYYVYGAVYSNIYLVSTLKEYYEENNIDYALKETIVSSEFYEELTSYEDLLVESNNMEVILRTNQIILDKYAIL